MSHQRNFESLLHHRNCQFKKDSMADALIIICKASVMKRNISWGYHLTILVFFLNLKYFD